MPFIFFPRQEEYLRFLWECYSDKENGLTEKARDMGATWECCAFSVWLWLYHSDTVIGWGSRKGEYVDKAGDPKAIFTKIRQQLSHLPPWMMPRGWRPSLHSTHMRIINPMNGSVITGEAGDNMGRGGRTSIYFKDESAHYEHPELVEAALGDNTDVAMDISSVNGPGTVFYRRRLAGEEWFSDKKCAKGMVRVFIFDWSHHPAKTKEWHDEREEKARREGLLHVFRQEVERDSLGSQDKAIIQAEWVRAAIDAHKVLGIEITGERIAGQDVADGGSDKNALIIRHGILMKYAHDWGGESGEAARIAIPHCIEHGVREVFYDSIGVGAGFRSETNNMRIPQGMKIYPWNAGESPVDPDKHIIPNDKQSPLNKDQYANLKAQAWFRMRSRFYKTFRAVKHGEIFPHDELISLDSTIPKINELIVQFSQAVYKSNSTGHTLVDKKPDGVFSPNLADGAVICYCPVRPPIGFFST